MGKPCDFFGELIGTFILVFFGCGAVAVTVLFNAHTSLFEVAFIWGLAVTFGIYATRLMSAAHLNPAVSLAMKVSALFFAKGKNVTDPCKLIRHKQVLIVCGNHPNIPQQ